jgi:hypothetical protein
MWIIEDPTATPAAKTQAWQEAQQIVIETRALMQQARNLTNDSTLKAFATAAISYLDQMVAAAAAEDLDAFSAAANAIPDLPESGGVQYCQI